MIHWKVRLAAPHDTPLAPSRHMARPLVGHDELLASVASSQPGGETTSVLIKQWPVTSCSTYGWQFRPPSYTWWPPGHQRWSVLAHRHPKTCRRCVCKVGLTFFTRSPAVVSHRTDHAAQLHRRARCRRALFALKILHTNVRYVKCQVRQP